MDKIKTLINNNEGRRLEFKAQLPENSDLAKTAIAFANDAGGDIFIGISDKPREIVGVDSENLMSTEERISNIIFDRCYPTILPEIKFVTIDDKHLIQVTIFRGNTPPYYLKESGKLKGTYMRVGSSNRVADHSIISELERRSRNLSYDGELILEKDISQIDFKTFKDSYLEKTGEELDIHTLRKLNLIKEIQGIEYPTIGLILLSDDPLRNSLYHFAKVECARFKGVTSENFIDKKSITSNIVTQAEEAYKFVLRNINENATVEGVYTISHWEYPIKAIREAIRNAIVHRDYSISGSDVKVAIYDDMIEITSPGLLFPSIDYNEKESRQSYARNKIIAPVFKQLGIIDQWGNGLKLISDQMKEYPNITLKWKEVGMSFQLQFIKTDFTPTTNENVGVNVGVNDKNVGVNDINVGVNDENVGVNDENVGVNDINVGVRRDIIELIMNNEGINSKEIATHFPNLASRTVERYIKELKDRSAIEFKGAPKTGGYFIVNK